MCQRWQILCSLWPAKSYYRRSTSSAIMAKGGKSKGKSSKTVDWVFCEACNGWFTFDKINLEEDIKKVSDEDFIFICKQCIPQKEKVSLINSNLFSDILSLKWDLLEKECQQTFTNFVTPFLTFGNFSRNSTPWSRTWKDKLVASWTNTQPLLQP